MYRAQAGSERIVDGPEPKAAFSGHDRTLSRRHVLLCSGSGGSVKLWISSSSPSCVRGCGVEQALKTLGPHPLNKKNRLGVGRIT